MSGPETVDQADAIKRLFGQLIVSLEPLAPRALILSAAQSAINLERTVDGFVAAAEVLE